MGMQKIEFEFPEPDGKEEDDGKIVIEDTSMTEVGAETVIKTEPELEPEKDEVVDKKPAPKEDEFEVEIVDDTPEADRNRKKSDPPEEVTDEELDNYSEKVKKRIKHFSKGYHDERRAKETAERERAELETLARRLMSDNEKLKGNMGKSQEALYKQAKRQIDNDLINAKREYKEAYDAGDGDKLLTAQEKLTTATIRSDKLKQIKIPTGQPPKGEVQTEVPDLTPSPEPTPQRLPAIDPRVKSWAEENTWFGQDKGMTAFALGYHNELVEDLGVDPASDDYYEKLNSRMRTVFPDSFKAAVPDKDVDTPRSTTVVAPATRTTAPRKVKLTKTQVTLAGRLGLTVEQYARQVAEEMRKGNV